MWCASQARSARSVREVQTATSLVHDLARRIGFVQQGAQLPQDITTATLVTSQCPIDLGRSRKRIIHTRPRWVGQGSRASPRTGGVSRRTGGPQRVRQRRVGRFERCIAKLGGGGRVADREDLSHLLGTQGFPRTSPGNHISARAQEFILGEATTLDARCVLLEAVFVLVTLSVAREMTGNADRPAPLEAPRRVPPTVPSDLPLECWQQLDQVDLSEVFLQRIPMLKSCPRFLRGQLRFSFGVALRERCRAKLNRDPVAELRAWKLFGLVPIVLLHKPKHGGVVGRDELAQRADDFPRGR